MEAKKDERALKGTLEILYASVTVRLRLPPGISQQMLKELGEFNQQHRGHLSINMIGTLHPHPEEGFDDVVVEHAFSDSDSFQSFLRMFCESADLRLVPLETVIS